MKRILDTFSVSGKTKVYEYPIDREVPTPSDVMEKLSYADAMAAIELMLVDEEFIRKHLRIGSTPPTRIGVDHPPMEHRRLQTLIYDTFGNTYICKE